MNHFASADQLETWLAQHAIDVSAYGKGQAKTVAQLWQEVEEGECFFTIPGSNVTRCVDVALVYIKNSNNKVLQEEYQIMPNGVKRARDVPLAEKIKDGETWQAAVVRAVKEELGSVLPLNPQVTIDESSHTKLEDVAVSRSYPGLQSKYTVHKVQVQVAGLPSADRFVTTEEKPDGVMENHWLWTSEMTVVKAEQ